MLADLSRPTEYVVCDDISILPKGGVHSPFQHKKKTLFQVFFSVLQWSAVCIGDLCWFHQKYQLLTKKRRKITFCVRKDVKQSSDFSPNMFCCCNIWNYKITTTTKNKRVKKGFWWQNNLFTDTTEKHAVSEAYLDWDKQGWLSYLAPIFHSKELHHRFSQLHHTVSTTWYTF